MAYSDAAIGWRDITVGAPPQLVTVSCDIIIRKIFEK